MKLYRYYCDKINEFNSELDYNNYDFPSEGIFSRLERIARANPEKYVFPIRYVSRKLCDGVPFPMTDIVLHNMKEGIPMIECFTELTTNIFKNDLEAIKAYLIDIHGMELQCVIIDIEEDSKRIIHRDNFQVILSI